MGIITALSATGLAAGLALTPVAASPAQAQVARPHSEVLEKRISKFCDRVPDLIVRVDKAQARISGDAKTRGSLARLKAHRAKAEAKHHELVVKFLDHRIERRTKRLANLPKVKVALEKAKTECATLKLPKTSTS